MSCGLVGGALVRYGAFKGGKFTQSKPGKAGQSESKASNAKLDEPRQSPANPSRDNSSLGLPFGQSRKCIDQTQPFLERSTSVTPSVSSE